MKIESDQAASCKGCGFRFNCTCEQKPIISSKINIALLLHKNELQRDTNTGKLISQCISNSQRFIWDRVNPPPDLIKIINGDDFLPVLLFPNENSFTLNQQTLSAYTKPPLFIILDATWQEAKKMVRQSPWLQHLPCIEISVETLSRYSLRRNQQKGHLCTSETASLLLNICGEQANARLLDDYFQYHLEVFKADKSGHKKASI